MLRVPCPTRLATAKSGHEEPMPPRPAAAEASARMVASLGATGLWLPRLLLPIALLLSVPAAGAGQAWAQDDSAGVPKLRPLPGPGARPALPVDRPLGGVPGGGPGSLGDEGAGASAAGPPPPQDEDAEGGGSADDPSPADAAGGSTKSDDAESSSDSASARGKPPVLQGRSTQVTIDFVDTPITDLIKYFAEITGRNFLLTDDLKGEVTIISHRPVSVGEAYEAFLSALESVGYTTVKVGQLTKVVPTGSAANAPLNEYYQGNIPYTDNYVTQIIQLDNVTVGDVSSVVKELAGTKAKVIAYSPTNTLIITDSAVNIRRVYRIVSQLDVAAPRASLRIFSIQHAQAAEVQKVINEIYGGAASDSSSASSASSGTAARRTANRRSARRNQEAAAASDASASSTTVGKEGNYIDKIITDERTNSIIVLANEEAMIKIQELIAQLDIDVDPQSRAQIQVVYLEHAKAEDVAQVLSNLSESSSSSSSSRTTNTRSRNLRGGADGAPPPGAAGDTSTSGSTVAALDGGVRITSDENTNSLVIVATPDQFQIIRQVIEKLDIRRKQVFVQAVILEMASEDTFELGLGLHGGIASDDDQVSFGSAQLGGSSLGLSADALSGLAMGIYGKSIDVPLGDIDGDGTGNILSIPAFGIALNALATNSAVNIVATPEILTMDNEEAKIVVGRNVPFPVSSGRDNNNNPIISYQREDVATTLKVTPQINESNYVTLELFQEVTEVEEDDSGLDVSTAGFITSKRSAETVVVVKDNQTVVIGGLIGSTDTVVETKFPILGDLPLIGNLFRGKRNVGRKTNLLIFLTPHIIEEPADLEEVYRIKWAQREEFIQRFYGKSREEQEAQLASLMRFSMNRIDEPSPWRTKPPKTDTTAVIGASGAVLQDDSRIMGDPIVAPEPELDAPDAPDDIDDIDDIDDPTMPTDGQ